MLLLVAFAHGSEASGGEQETFSRRLLPTDFWSLVSSPSRHLRSGQKSVPALIPARLSLNAVFDLNCLRHPKGHKGVERIRHQVVIPKARLRAVGSRAHRSHLHSVTWQPSKSMTWAELDKLVAEERCLRALAPDTTFHALAEEGASLSRQEHLPFIGWPTAIRRLRPIAEAAPPAVIAVIDTGVDLSHAALAPNAWVNKGEIPGNGLDDDLNGYIDDIHGFDFGTFSGDSGPKSRAGYFSHGTHVAGLAAAHWSSPVSGVNGGARIMSLNVFGPRRAAKVSTLENALRYAVDNGATVVNLSIGGREYTRSMRETLRYAVRKGVVVVAAAGNEGMEISRDPRSRRFVTPAAYGKDINGMITVTSVDSRTGRLSAFSNFSLFLVELAAPGAYRSGELGNDGLFSTVPSNRYGSLAGTSMAAPVVSGAAGLVQAWLHQAGRAASPAFVEQALTQSARTGAGALVFTRSGGVLDLDRLVAWLQREAPLP